MNNLDRQYFELLNHILKNGKVKGDRTGTGTKSVFDYTIRHKMSEGAAVLTSKKVYFKGVKHELLWFLKGDTNIENLIKNGVHIWDGDSYKNYLNKFDYKAYGYSATPLSKEEFIQNIKANDDFAKIWGELGPVYGAQWRHWENFIYDEYDRDSKSSFKVDEVHKIDQISNLLNDLRTNPDSRRLMVSAWNVADINKMVLPPCHYVFQCYTAEMTTNERIEYWCKLHGRDISFGKELSDLKLDSLGVPKRTISLKFTMRSTDIFLGLPFNLASYGLLLQMLANEVNMVADELIFSGGDCHIYLNHIEPCKIQLSQKVYDLPKIRINKDKSIFDLDPTDIKLINYESSPAIKGELSN